MVGELTLSSSNSHRERERTAALNSNCEVETDSTLYQIAARECVSSCDLNLTNYFVVFSQWQMKRSPPLAAAHNGVIRNSSRLLQH